MRTLVVCILILVLMVSALPTYAEDIAAFQSYWWVAPLGNVRHTYIKFTGVTGVVYRYANPGSVGNGYYVPYTLGVINGSRAICHSGSSTYAWYYKFDSLNRLVTYLLKGSPWCTIRWLVDGTCHNGSNRILFASGKIVNYADGYWITYQLFKNYGTSVSWNNCYSTCLYS
ncbi:MAG: hypothetical protein HZB30_09835 [Nitrospirae bacterium]|nr:hypothetical protein [Nitrospirota bacterium]